MDVNEINFAQIGLYVAEDGTSTYFIVTNTRFKNELSFFITKVSDENGVQPVEINCIT